ncbi:hypothetical protein J6590_046444 [Homalodisca vitripennis]|nr:hypothetical protein J6590_046444 [Homalodisca vitripennis]
MTLAKCCQVNLASPKSAGHRVEYSQFPELNSIALTSLTIFQARVVLSGKFGSIATCWASSRIQSVSSIKQYCIDLVSDISGTCSAVSRIQSVSSIKQYCIDLVNDISGTCSAVSRIQSVSELNSITQNTQNHPQTPNCIDLVKDISGTVVLSGKLAPSRPAGHRVNTVSFKNKTKHPTTPQTHSIKQYCIDLVNDTSASCSIQLNLVPCNLLGSSRIQSHYHINFVNDTCQVLSGKFGLSKVCWASSGIQSVSRIKQYCIDLVNDISGTCSAVSQFPVLNSIALTLLAIFQARVVLSGKFGSIATCWASSRIQSVSRIKQYCIDLVNLAPSRPAGHRVEYSEFPELNSIALTSLKIFQARVVLQFPVLNSIALTSLTILQPRVAMSVKFGSTATCWGSSRIQSHYHINFVNDTCQVLSGKFGLSNVCWEASQKQYVLYIEHYHINFVSDTCQVLSGESWLFVNFTLRLEYQKEKSTISLAMDNYGKIGLKENHQSTALILKYRLDLMGETG